MPLTEAPPDALAATYARSLFELAESQGGKDRIERCAAEIEAVLDLARADKAFAEFLSSRVIATKQRTQSLRSIFATRLSDLTLHFLLVLNEKDRLSHLPAIVAAFDDLLQQRFGRVEVDLYTAAPVEPAQLEPIKDKLRAALGREPVIHAYTDPAMIGGIRLQIGDQLIDASVKTRLARLRDQLARSGMEAIRARAERLLTD